MQIIELINILVDILTFKSVMTRKCQFLGCHKMTLKLIFEGS